MQVVIPTQQRSPCDPYVFLGQGAPITLASAIYAFWSALLNYNCLDLAAILMNEPESDLVNAVANRNNALVSDHHSCATASTSWKL